MNDKCPQRFTMSGFGAKSEKKTTEIPVNESMIKLMETNSLCCATDAVSFESSEQSLNDVGIDGQKRGTWNGRMDFLLSCVGYAVGLGNIWRFPYLCYDSGGGAFLIPYTIFLFVCGLPLFLLELSFGQFASRGPITIWRICPLFKGLGYGMVIISGIVCIYYNIIITWIIYYMYLSINTVLPWSTCENWWNTDQCFLRHHNNSFDTLISTSNAQSNMSFGIDNMTIVNLTREVAVKRTTASDEFWLRYVLQASDGIDDIGGVRWELFICLIVAWICIFLCLFRGVKSSGRVVYFSATFPFVVLVILLIRGVTLPGAINGIKFYVTPQWEELLKFEVWGRAAVQIFYSLGPAWGGLLTMASYNKFNNNVYRDAIMVPLINCGTSVFAGFVIFSVVGFMAEEANMPVKEVVSQGPGLAFVVYPEAVIKLPISPLWSFLFFFMLFTVGLDSQFGMFETMISAFVDEFPTVLKKRKLLFTISMCFLLFLLGIPLVTKAGIYMFMLMDWYCAVFALMVISLTECLVLSYIYGIDRFMADISLMIKKELPVGWKYVFMFITPLTILFILLFTFINYKPIRFQSYEYPSWAIAIGWMMALCPVVPIPTLMIIQILMGKGSLKDRIIHLMTPTPEWGPALEEHRILYHKSVNLIPPKLKQKYISGVSDDAESSDLSSPPSYNQIIADDNGTDV